MLIGTNQKIKVLKSLKDQIDSLEDGTDSGIWVIKATDTLKAYLGKDSGLFKAIANFSFAELNSTPNNKPYDFMGAKMYSHFNEKNEKEKAKKLIDACVETIINFAPIEFAPIGKETVVATMELFDEVISKIPQQPTNQEIFGELVLQILHLQARVNMWDLEFDETIAEDDPELADAVRKAVNEKVTAEFYRLCENQNDVSEYLNHVLQQYLKKPLE